MEREVPIIERSNLELESPDSFNLYQGQANPNGSGQISWTLFNRYQTRVSAVKVMRVLFQESGGLWLIMREIPVAGMLPQPDPEDDDGEPAAVPETERYPQGVPEIEDIAPAPRKKNG